MSPNDVSIDSFTLSSGETKDVPLDDKPQLELGKSDKSNKTLHISSNKRITVQSVSLRKQSMQTALLIPTENLSTDYVIPPVPTIKGTTDPKDIVTQAVTERGPFRLIIVNSDKPNKVTVEGKASQSVSLSPGQTAQVWLNPDDELRVVKASEPVSVLFGHSCAFLKDCSCGLVYTILPPKTDEEQTFIIPPQLATDDGKETVVLLSDGDSTKEENFKTKFSIAGTAILYRPGLLITLIPESDFASCYTITALPSLENFAVIVTHKDSTADVHVGLDSKQGEDWKEVKDTDYVSARVSLPAGKNIIWHGSSKMAVYFLGKNDVFLVGNPAAAISRSPGMEPQFNSKHT